MGWIRDRSWAALALALAFTLASGGWATLDAAFLHRGVDSRIGTHFERTERHHADVCLMSAGLAVQKSIAAPEPVLSIGLVPHVAEPVQDHTGIIPSLQHPTTRSRAPPLASL